MSDRSIRSERALNIWSSFQRSVSPLARGAAIIPAPELDFDEIGGLAAAKEEILTYAYAQTSPEIYCRWGTFWSQFEGRTFHSRIASAWVNGVLAWDGERLVGGPTGPRLAFAR